MAWARAPVTVAALAACVVLAGCGDRPTTRDDAEDPILVTAPDDYSYLQGTNDSRPHLHDYWFGADTVLVLDETVADVGPGAAGGQVVIYRFEPPSGAVVPLGTASVEVLVEWEDATGDMYSAPELWVETAADHEPWLVGPLESGVAMTVESNNTANDLPHQLLSAWAFEFRLSSPPAPQPFLRFKGEVSMLATAHRGLDIPLFPAHPDHWGEARELPLLEVTHTLAYAHDPGDGGCDGVSCQEVHTPMDGHIVPPDAAQVAITFTQSNRAAFPLGVAYHTAESRDFVRAVPVAEQGDTATYELAVEGYGDGPYAEQSQWAFLVVIDGPVTDGVTVAEYTLSATVLRGPA